jgi:hypothetical protein
MIVLPTLQKLAAMGIELVQSLCPTGFRGQHPRDDASRSYPRLSVTSDVSYHFGASADEVLGKNWDVAKGQERITWEKIAR